MLVNQQDHVGKTFCLERHAVKLKAILVLALLF